MIPVVSQFEPDWVLVSAGFDGHTEDPLADLDLLDADYRWMASRLARPTRPTAPCSPSKGVRPRWAPSFGSFHGARHGGRGPVRPPLTSAPAAPRRRCRRHHDVARHWSL